jgi:hypothetical protein
MIVLRKKAYAFRDRAPEWILSCGLVLWGIMMSITPDLFTVSSFYQPLLAIMPQNTWATLTILIGVLRLLALTINGVWRPTAHFRALGAVGGCIVWGSLLSISVIDSSARAPGISLLSMLLAFEFMALWWAAGDAKLVDSAAKSKKEANGI